MHHIYHTEGIILGSRNFGEAGKYYSLFTRDLGFIYASAQGVRKMSSKLRFVLQDYSYIKVDLIKGKDFWRVTSASKGNGLESLTKTSTKFEVFYNLAKLLKKLLAGEEPNESLFNDVLSGLYLLEKTEKEEDLRNVEVVMVLRILNNLGYIGGSKDLETLISSPFEQDLVLEVFKQRKEVLKHINQALKETHLL